MSVPTDGTTALTAVADCNIWPQIKFDIGDMDITLTSVSGRSFREEPEMLEPNI